MDAREAFRYPVFAAAALALWFVSMRFVSFLGASPGEERLSLRDLGFEFGPDPTEDIAWRLAAGMTAHWELSVPILIVFACMVYWVWTSRGSDDAGASVLIAQGRDVQLAHRRAQALEDLRRRDPAYDEAAFLRRASAAFLRIQDALGANSPFLVRAFLSDGMHERFKRALDAQADLGYRERNAQPKVLEAEALGYAAGRHYDAVSVRFKASAAPERVELPAGRALPPGERRVFEEVWTFLRRPGARTLEKPGPLEGCCPSCGAGLAVVDAALCPHCKNCVNSGEHDWVLAEITSPAEWRFPDPNRDVTGWPELREEDPGLSLETIEDRAALVFWRWLESRRRGDAALLRAASSEAFRLRQRFDGSYERRVSLGAVEVAAFVPGTERDQVHVQVRWQAEAASRAPGAPEALGWERRTHFVVFERRAGVETSGRAGLATERCPSCGAAPQETAAALCAYCGKDVQWILSAIVPFGEWKRPDLAPRAAVLPGADFGDMAPAETLAALAYGMAADGAFHHHELAFLRACAARRGVPPEQLELLVLAAREKRLDPPGAAVGEETLLRGLIRMSLADGVIEEPERRLLSAVARRAGLHESDLRALIRAERSALIARADELVRRLG